MELFLALLHESDHRWGKVYLDRMDDMSKLAFTDQRSRYMSEEPDTKEGAVLLNIPQESNQSLNGYEISGLRSNPRSISSPCNRARHE